MRTKGRMGKNLGKTITATMGYVVFVNAMSDLFHEKLSVEDIRKICEVMRDVPRHIYQVLTKRAERMRELLTLLLNLAKRFSFF